MAAKKDTKDAPKVLEVVPESRSAVVGGIAISPEDAAVLQGDIDSRMAALLKDHQEMGSRPK